MHISQTDTKPLRAKSGTPFTVQCETYGTPETGINRIYTVFSSSKRIVFEGLTFGDVVTFLNRR